METGEGVERMLEAVREMGRHLGFRQRDAVEACIWALLDERQRAMVYEFVAGLCTPRD